MGHDSNVEAMNVLGHELRRPLTVIRGAATLLLEASDEMEPESRVEMLRLIDGGAEDMAEMIEDLLAAVHLEAGDLHLGPEPIEAARLIEQAVRRSRRIDPERPVTIGTAPAELRVTADPGYAQRALRALVANALTHTPARSEVEVAVLEEAAGARFEVSDRGPGVPADDVERAFGRFTRLQPGSSGLGLGLFVARGLARAMGGDAGLAPRPGGGCVAWLTLTKNG